MAGDTVQQIKDRLSIVDVVSQYVKLERSGSSLRARCPFHAEKSPSFFVSPERGTYHCFGCNVGGDMFSFVEAIEGLDFKGALKVLAEKAGVELVYSHGRGKEEKNERDRLFELVETATIFYASRLTDEAKKYLKERGLSPTTISAFRLGWAGDAWSECTEHLKGKKFSEKEIIDAGLAKKGERGTLSDKFRNRIVFPIADSAGRVVGFSGRIFGEKASPEAPKYLNSPETPLFHKSNILYGFDRAKMPMRKHNFAILVEGQMDLLASHQSGWTNTVATSGTALTSEQAQLIKRMTNNLVIALDNDMAGIKAAGRGAWIALPLELDVKVAQIPNDFDPADLILKQGKNAWNSAIRDAKNNTIIRYLLDTLEKHIPDKERFNRQAEISILPFIQVTRNPIQQDKYIKEVSFRLGVSVEAIREAIQRMPIPNEEVNLVKSNNKSVFITRPSLNDSRPKQAFAIFLWQQSVKNPLLDLDRYKIEFEEAIGKDIAVSFNELSETEKENLRFSAESLYGASSNLTREAKPLLQVIHRERLKTELDTVNMALRKAENSNDEKEVERLSAVSKMLTTRIAQLHESV